MCIATESSEKNKNSTMTANSRHPLQSDEQDVGAEDITDKISKEQQQQQQQQKGDNRNDDLVWYFSYGSNMNPEIFETKRKIKCIDYAVCTVPGYVLTYSESTLPYFEPAFCTCVKRSDLPCCHSRPDIHGVAFLITRQQYEHMLVTEGGWGWQEYRDCPFWGIGHYGEEEIECVEIQPDRSRCGSREGEGTSENESESATAGATETATTSAIKTTRPLRRFKAMTLVGLFGHQKRYDAHCSKRYYDIVNEGALSSGLPSSYRDYLRDHHPAYKPSHDCWKTKLAMRIYLCVAMPCFFLEFGTLHLFIHWNERKLVKTKERQQQQQQESSQDASKKTSTPKRKRFENVVRPPWIIMKICHLYRAIVLERITIPLLVDWCKLPDGYRNPCCADSDAVVGNGTTTGDSAAAVSASNETVQ